MRAPLLILVALLSVAVGAQAPAPAHLRARETALDRYVAAPDAAFAFSEAGALPGVRGVHVILLDLTSQRWVGPGGVDRPEWKHWLVVYRPPEVQNDIGFLYIGGGRNDRERPRRINPALAAMAQETGTIVAELRMVPNQPLTLLDDPERKPRLEDDLIAYTWDRYLRSGDERWPLRLPMTKAVVRAMDALTSWTAGERGRAVRRFVLSGASKRGWTTWTAAAVDTRVVAIAPLVIDALNVETSFVHHWQVYGFWAPAVEDYVNHGIMRWMGSREFAALMRIEDPWSYRDRLTMPKYIVNSTGDQFFLPDSSRFYFDGLPGEKHLRYVPNSDHSLEDTDAPAGVQAFYASIVADRPRPRVTWRTDPDGALRVTSSERPDRVRLWQAVNPDARDFRLETIGKAWQSTALEAAGPNTWIARVEPPAAGWKAYFVELTFPPAGRHPLIVSTGVQVVPDKVPYPPPQLSSPAGLR